ncbi:protein of unknown function [Methylotuvimicrobium alcaliphilum 20Z]|uniref:Uncharacterized protein n=1 Tax=Methylotuvimicrobium alcaliphilum (strain DSM 19304 / NCIMB 14124 / VKM B-2133 / 20Z) TaxID=1091494 RepID=G4T0C8_META2|nr:protein of unknown function [Methylotuvimicrobium alcaliphilum 20Z]
MKEAVGWVGAKRKPIMETPQTAGNYCGWIYKIRSARDSVVGLKRWVSASASTHPT